VQGRVKVGKAALLPADKICPSRDFDTSDAVDLYKGITRKHRDRGARWSAIREVCPKDFH
jgi:hypothetical protein